MSDEKMNGNGSNGNEEMILCPRSHPGNWHGESVPNMHHASQVELSAHGGVCAACYFGMKKRNVRWQNGEVETPADFSLLHHVPDQSDHTTLTNHGAEKFADFNYADVDADAVDEVTADYFADASRECRHDAGTALGLVLGWIWSNGWQTAQRRFATVTAGLRPDLLDNLTYQEIGARTGTSKAAISKAAINFQKKFRLKFSRGRGEEARRNMSIAATGHKPTNIKGP